MTVTCNGKARWKTRMGHDDVSLNEMDDLNDIIESSASKLSSFFEDIKKMGSVDNKVGISIF